MKAVNEKSVGALATELFEDGQKLVNQEIQLLRLELKEEWEKTQRKAWYLGLATASGFLAVLLFSQMLAFQLVGTAKLDITTSLGIVAFGFIVLAAVFYGAKLNEGMGPFVEHVLSLFRRKKREL